MARTSVTTQVITADGLNVNRTGPVADGDIIDTGNTILDVVNGSGVSVTVTIQNPLTVEGRTVANLAVAIPAGQSREIKVSNMYRQATDAVVGPGRALVDYSAVASVTRAVKRLG